MAFNFIFQSLTNINKIFRFLKVGVARLPTTPFYMITASFKAKICTTFCTANQFIKPNLINLFDSLSNQLFFKIIISTNFRLFCNKINSALLKAFFLPLMMPIE